MSRSAPVVFIVDADEHVRHTYARLVRSAGHQAETCDSAAAFFTGVSRLKGPACVLLDLTLPDLNGLEVQRQIDTTVPVIFVSARGDIDAAIAAMKAGAVDFLAKPVDERMLLNAITLALNLADALSEIRTQRTELQERASLLTRREREVMELVVAGLLNKQIAASLGASEKTIKIHRAKVMEKMQAGSLPDLVRIVGQLDAFLA